MHSTPKCFDSSSQISGMTKSDERLFGPQAFRITQGYLFSLLCLLGQILKYGQVFFIGEELAGCEKQVLCEVSVVKSRNG